MNHRDLFGYYDAFSEIRDQMDQWQRVSGRSPIDEALAASQALSRDMVLIQPDITGRALAELAEAAGAVRAGYEDLVTKTDMLSAQRALHEEMTRAAALLPAAHDMIAVRSAERTIAENLANYQAAYEDVLGRLEALRSPLASVAAEAALQREVELRALLEQAPSIDRFVKDTLVAIDWARLSETFGSIAGLQSTAQALTAAYDDIYPIFPDHALPGLHSLVEGFAPVEVFNHTNLLYGLGRSAGSRPEKAAPRPRQETDELREAEAQATLLSLLKARWPQLLPLWQGAHQALGSDNPDRVRHFIVSYRELLTHLIHFLAPDDRVLPWVAGNREHLHNHRPTRPARLLYISRNINRRNFGPFVVQDVGAVVAVFQLFHKGTHAIEAGFSPRDLIELQIRADNALLFLLKVAEESDRHTS